MQLGTRTIHKEENEGKRTAIENIDYRALDVAPRCARRETGCASNESGGIAKEREVANMLERGQTTYQIQRGYSAEKRPSRLEMRRAGFGVESTSASNETVIA